jgi:hypothetical protein
MFGLSLDPIFNSKSRNHNEFELWSPLPPFLDHLINQTILIELLMVATMLGTNTSASSVAISPILNGTVFSIPVKFVIKLRQDTHHKHVEDVFTMMVFMDIMI